MSKKITVQIDYPNDYGSDSRFAAMMEDFGVDTEDSSFDFEREVFEKMADAAEKAGLEFLMARDYGARWNGTESEITRARELIPGWASISVIDEA